MPIQVNCDDSTVIEIELTHDDLFHCFGGCSSRGFTEFMLCSEPKCERRASALRSCAHLKQPAEVK